MSDVSTTTVKVSGSTRDRLAAMARKGESMEDVIVTLLEEHQRAQARRRMAWERRLAKADANPNAVAWAEKTADDMAVYLKERQAARQ
ncbi:hypothetical protein [Nocardia sp. NPDC004711]